MKIEPRQGQWPGQVELRREAELEPSSDPQRALDSPGPPEAFSLEGLAAAREALLNPRNQLRSAVALQIGQLNELALMLTRFQDLIQTAGLEGASWLERSLAAQEASSQGLQDLTEAKRQQEEVLLSLRQGLTAAKDEDTARLEAGLRNFASAAQEFRNATETVGGAGRRFGSQVGEALLAVEESLPAAVEKAGLKLEEPILRLRAALRPLTWTGGALGLLLVVDMAVRLFR